jgi:ADP-ribose pyrophosphatase
MITHSQLVYQDPWLSLHRDECIRPDGAPGSYSTVHLKAGVCVLAVEQPWVYLTQEFHYAVGRETIEGVSGGIEPEETAEQAARRELREELGIEADHWEHLGQVDPFTAAVYSPTQLWIASRLRFVPRELEGTEVIQTVRAPIEQAIQWVEEGTISHAPTCVLLLRWALRAARSHSPTSALLLPLIVGWLLVGLSPAQRPTAEPPAAGVNDPLAVSDHSASQRLVEALIDGDYSQARQLLAPLPSDRRWEVARQAYQEWPTGAAGGVSVANFAELMNLIRTVITPDGWDEDQSLLPYPGGVWLDPQGMIRTHPARAERSPGSQEYDSVAARPVEWPRWPPLPGGVAGIRGTPPTIDHAASVPTDVWEGRPLRWLNLSEIEAAVADLERQPGRRIDMRLELLGGITQLQYLAYRAADQSWHIGGPAGDLRFSNAGYLVSRSSGRPTLLLEDLLELVRPCLLGDGLVGCSIEPTDEQLQRLQTLIEQPDFLRQLAGRSRQVPERLKAAMGPQPTIMLGLPADSPTGLALLVADQHMKRIGFGLEPAGDGLENYWQHARRTRRPNPNGLIRWWFTLSPTLVACSPEGDVFRLPDQPLELLSERQWIDAAGQRLRHQPPDPAADRFADQFTQQLDRLASEQPIYGRLVNIASLTVALEVIRQQQLEKTAGLPPWQHLLESSRRRASASRRAEWVEPIATMQAMPSGYVSAAVSGGVLIRSRSVIGFQPESGRWERPPALERSGEAD